MMTKPKYNINTRSNNPWEPKAIEAKANVNNRNSVGYNILNHKENPYSPNLVVGLLDNKVANKKKGIGEFSDLQKPSAININPDHKRAYCTDPSVFKHKDGMFAHLYDAAHRIGDSKPFGNHT